jgi:diacylglycerol kinase (ATP)
MRTLFIVNPTSGRDRSAHLRRKLLDRVAAMPDAAAIVLTVAGEARRVALDAARDGCDRIVVAGGDGTVNEVINGIGDSRVALGVVPLGTGNVLAYELDLRSEDLDGALEVISKGNVREFDLGLAGDTRFLLMAGFGFDAEVVRSVPPRAKGLFGRMAYAPTLIRESVCYRPSTFRIVLDDETALSIAAYNVIICNCASYAPNFQIAPDAVPDDGLLDVLIFEHRPAMKLRFLGWLSASLITRWAADPCAVHHRAAHVRIDSEPPVKMQLDGDVRGESGVEIRVLPKALRLIVP